MMKDREEAQLLTLLVNSDGKKSYLNMKTFEKIIDETNKIEYIITAKAYREEPAKGVFREITDENMKISFCFIKDKNKDEDEDEDKNKPKWAVISQYLISKEDIKKYLPIYEYNKNIVNGLNNVINTSSKEVYVPILVENDN